MNQWVSFKDLRTSVSFETVLRYYGVELKLKGDQHHGFCPLPTHQGKRNSASFSANLKRGIWQCFGCGAKGNVIDFAAYMEGLNPNIRQHFRKAALLLQERFVGVPSNDSAKSKPRSEKVADEPAASPVADKPVVVNAPLDFVLKQLDASHPYLHGRGFQSATIEHFGLGYCGRGLLTGRIAIPLHDSTGALVGYAGRLVDDAAIAEGNPRYKFPSQRERQGGVHEFHKSKFLYNGFRIVSPADDLIVVEGFPSVWWLWQWGLVKVVALMGWACSEEQARLIVSLVKPQGHVWIVPDGDEAGERCAANVFRLVAPQRFVRWVKLEPGKQPTEWTAEQLTGVLPK